MLANETTFFFPNANAFLDVIHSQHSLMMNIQEPATYVAAIEGKSEKIYGIM
jgi:hypothetical protein